MPRPPDPAAQAVHHDEVLRIGDLWKEARDQARDREVVLEGLQAAAGLRLEEKESQHQEEMGKVQDIVAELRTRLRFAESSLRRVKDERDGFRRAASEARALAEQKEELGQQQVKAIKQLQKALRSMEEQVRNVTLDLEEERSRTVASEHHRKGQLKLRDQRIQAEEEKLRLQEEDIRYLESQLGLYRKRVAESDQKILQMEAIQQDVTSELFGAKEELKELFSSRQAHYRAIDASERALKDNARILKLLAFAAENYEPLKTLLEEWKDSAGASFVGSVAAGGDDPAEYDLDSLLDFKSLKAQYRVTVGEDAIDVGNIKVESSRWVPTPVYELAAEFRRRHCPGLPWEPLGQFLLRLNVLWRTFSTRKILRVQSKYHKKVAHLRRKLNQALPYSSVTQRVEIDKLRSLLKAATSHDRQNQVLSEPLLASTMKTAERLSQQVKVLAEENMELRKASGGQLNSERDIRLFLRGVKWQSTKGLDTLDRLLSRFSHVQQDLYKSSLDVTTSKGKHAFINNMKIFHATMSGLEEALLDARRDIQATPRELPYAIDPLEDEDVLGDSDEEEAPDVNDFYLPPGTKLAPAAARADASLFEEAGSVKGAAGGDAAALAASFEALGAEFRDSDEEGSDDSDEDADEWRRRIQRLNLKR